MFEEILRGREKDHLRSIPIGIPMDPHGSDQYSPDNSGHATLFWIFVAPACGSRIEGVSSPHGPSMPQLNLFIKIKSDDIPILDDILFLFRPELSGLLTLGLTAIFYEVAILNHLNRNEIGLLIGMDLRYSLES